MEFTILKEVAKLGEWDQFWIVASVAFLWSYKLLRGAYITKKYRNTETLDKLVAYLSRPISEQDILIKELLFESHFGRALSWNEIKYFKAAKDSAKSIKAYLSCMEYLEVNEVGMKLKVRRNKNLCLRKIGYFIAYTLFGTATIGLLSTISELKPDNIIIWIALLSSGVLMSGLFLHQGTVAATAQRLFKELNA